MSLLFSKTYDYKMLLMSNYFLSQFVHKKSSKTLSDISGVTYITLKRKKNKIFSNFATALSILLLLFGCSPWQHFQIGKPVDRYQCTWQNKKLFYNLDLLFFLLLPKLKKSKELIHTKRSSNTIEICFFNLLNVYVLKLLDNDTNLITNVSIVNQLSNDIIATREITFFQKALPI